MFWRVAYGIILLLNIIAYFLPWYQQNNEVYAGYEMMIPFTFTYFFGLLLGLVVLLTKYKPLGLTIAAGILIIIGIMGGIIGIGIGGAIESIPTGTEISSSSELGNGLILAVIFSLLYITVGSIFARKMAKFGFKVELA